MGPLLKFPDPMIPRDILDPNPDSHIHTIADRFSGAGGSSMIKNGVTVDQSLNGSATSAAAGVSSYKDLEKILNNSMYGEGVMGELYEFLGGNVQNQNNVYSLAETILANEQSINNAKLANQMSQENATTAFLRQKQLNKDAMEFNAEEAQKARDYDMYMSNTAVQRKMSDLKAAGLNPILAYAQGGSTYGGAGSGASIGNSTAQSAQAFQAPVQRQDIDQESNAKLLNTVLGIVGEMLAINESAKAQVSTSYQTLLADIARGLAGNAGDIINAKTNQKARNIQSYWSKVRGNG